MQQEYGWMAKEWIASDVPRPDLVALYAALDRQHDAIRARYPGVAVRRPAPARGRPLLTAGALVTLWDRWTAMTGTCPACGGRVVGTDFNGYLSRADVFGVCLGCALAERRPVQGGIMMAVRNANAALAGTPYRCGPPWGPSAEEPYADLVAALQELGESGLHRGVGAHRPGA